MGVGAVVYAGMLPALVTSEIVMGGGGESMKEWLLLVRRMRLVSRESRRTRSWCFFSSR